MCTREQETTMNLKYLINILAVICISAGSLVSVQAQTEGLVIDKIISKVDNYIVLKSDLERTYSNYLAQGNSGGSETKCRVLAQLISQKLMVAKAEIDSVIVLDAEVENNLNRRMQFILAQYGGSEKELEQYFGKGIDKIKNDVRDEIKEQMVVERMQQTIVQDLKVTPAEVRRFFGRIPSDSLPYFSAEVEVAQIVKIPEVGQEGKDEVRRKLSAIRERIVNGESFEELAKEYSQGPSGKDGGNLGFAKRGTMAPEYEATALKQKPGGVSYPFETEFGTHIVQLIERRGNEYNSRHILITPEPSTEDLERTSNFLDSLKNLVENDSITFEKAAKEHSDDVLTSNNGGYFRDQSESARVSVEDLDPVVFFTIDTMAIGKITKPLPFRTERGKDALRILYYKSKLSPHQADLSKDWQKIQAATLEEKRQRQLNKWFNEARGDVFISIDDEFDKCKILN